MLCLDHRFEADNDKKLGLMAKTFEEEKQS